MQKTLTIAAALGMFIGVAGAEEFYLKWEKTGKVYGPFSTSDGSEVQIGSAAFTVVQKAKSEAERRLSAITFPQIEMRQAHHRDAIDFLRRQVKAFGKRDEPVNFVIAPAKRETKPEPASRDPFAPVGGASGMGRSAPRVTLQVRDVTALQALKLITDQVGATYRMAGNTVTIVLKEAE